MEKKASDSRRTKDVLGDKVKQLEQAFEKTLRNDQFVIVRIDGNCFHTLTRSFDKPMDDHMKQCMIAATRAVMDKMGAVTAFTQSDEITLVILPTNINSRTNQREPLPFSGRVQKWTSLLASLASVTFTNEMRQIANDPSQKMTAKKRHILATALPIFDCRVFNVSNVEDVRDVFLWRYLYDTYDNGIGSMACFHFPNKQLEKLSTGDRRIKLETEKGIKLEHFPPHLLYGTFIKRKQVEQCNDRSQSQKTKDLGDSVRLKKEHVYFSQSKRQFDSFDTKFSLFLVEPFLN